MINVQEGLGFVMTAFVVLSIILFTFGFDFKTEAAVVPEEVIAPTCAPCECSCFTPEPQTLEVSVDTDTVEYIKQVLTIKANQRR